MVRLKQAFILLPLVALLTVTAAARQNPTPEVSAKDEAAFFESVQKGDAADVRRRLASGASANARAGDDESSALSVAVASGRPGVVRLLLEHKADVNYGDANGHSNLMVAATAASLAALPPEVFEFASAGMDPLGESLSRDVSRAERLEVLRLLIGAGADANLAAGDCGLTALIGAAMYGDPEVTRVLLEAGADPNVGAREFNPLRFATLTLAELLRQGGGAEPGEDARRSATIFYEATATGRAEVARLLRRAGAK